MNKYIVGLLLTLAFGLSNVQQASSIQKVPFRMLSAPGVVLVVANSTQPDYCLFAFGQSVLRATYPDLFTAIGTTYGAVDGTHFTLPDLRGRTVFGDDNMGGSAASRVTNAISGINGATLGAVGGSESMQTHTHTQNSHVHTQDAHSHSINHGHSIRTAAGGVTEPSNASAYGFAALNATGTSTYINVAAANGLAFVQALTGDSGLSTPTINTSTAVNQNTGAGSSQNMPPTIVLNYCILF